MASRVVVVAFHVMSGGPIVPLRMPLIHLLLDSISTGQVAMFRSLLKVFFSKAVLDVAPLEEMTTLSDWKEVLRLSSSWRPRSDGNTKMLSSRIADLAGDVRAHEQDVQLHDQAVTIHHLQMTNLDPSKRPKGLPPTAPAFPLGPFIETMKRINPLVDIDDSIYGILRQLSTEALGRKVFVSANFSRSLSRRNVDSKSFVETALMSSMRETAETTTQLIGGTSGAGKTYTAIGLSGGSCFPVLMAIQDVDDWYRSTRKTISKEKVQRDKDVLDLLAYLVEKILGESSTLNGVETSALQTLRDHSDTNKPIILPIVLDEVGRVPELVRAMAALGGSEVRGRLGLSAAVKVFLVAVGTGVGEKGILWGSENSSYEAHIINNNDANETIFNNILGNNNGLNVAPIIPIIQSNARLAAVCANLLVEVTKDFGPQDPTPEGNEDRGFPILKKSFDVTSIFPQASLRFRRLNALSSLKESDMAFIMSSALRMHLYPFCHTMDAGFIEVNCGLVADMAIVAKKKCDSTEGFLWWDAEKGASGSLTQNIAIPRTGRYFLPRFAMPLLSSLCGMPWVTRVGLDGDSLEEYWLNASALAACAASNATLFSLMLESGTLAPLAHYRSKAVMDRLQGFSLGTSGLKAVDDDAWLKHNRFRLLISDLQAEGIVLGYRSEPSVYFSKFEEEVKARIRKYFHSDKEKEKAANKSVSAIAAFRSPPKFPFADTALFVNNRLFLFQLRVIIDGADDADADAAAGAGSEDGKYHWTDVALLKELLKMGLPEADAKEVMILMAEAAEGKKKKKKTKKKKSKSAAQKVAQKVAGTASEKKKTAAARQMVESLKSFWAETTGYTIEAVEYCFVSPKGHVVPDHLAGKYRFLDTDNISFMKFNPSRKYQECLVLQ